MKLSFVVYSRDGPKFGRRIRPNVRLGNMWLFGRSLAELRQTFGVICSFASAAFCARRSRSQYSIYLLL